MMVRDVAGRFYGRVVPRNSQVTDWITDRVPTKADADFEDQVHVPMNLTLSDNPSFVSYTSIQLGQPWMHTDQVVPVAKRQGAKVEAKPPLGLKPRWLALEQRELEIRMAIMRYEDQATLVPDEWLLELADIEHQLKELLPQQPAETGAFKVGQLWRDGEGNEVSICAKHKDGFQGDNFYYYDLNGRWRRPHIHLPCILDLVELIEDAPEPEPVPAPKPTRSKVEIPEPIRTGAAPFYVVVASDDSAKDEGDPIVWETYIPAGSSLQAVLQQQRRLGSRYGTSYIAECRIIPELTRLEGPADAD